MIPYWLEEPSQPLSSRRFAGRADVAIVGGGVTGCSCALALARSGVRVRLHEARTVAGGASGRNGGFALRGGAMPYDAARTRLGPERARWLWVLSERALDAMSPIAGDALRRVGSLRLAVDAAEASALRAEHDALVGDGFAAEWVAEPPGPLAGRFAAGLLHLPDGALQPARWIRRLAAAAAEAGVEIREGSAVESLEALDADAVVVATDGFTGGLLPELATVAQATRGQVLVTERLPEILYGRPHYSRWGYDYWHQTPDGRLVLGGRRDVSPEAEQTAVEATTPLIQAELERFAAELVGRPPLVTHRWAGIWATTPDLLPLVGRVPGREGVWVAVGYSGHGNVLGFACGQLVAQAILGAPAPELALLDPARLELEPG